MSEVLNEAQQEFWRPPSPTVAEAVAAPETTPPAMAEVCPRCGSEFLFGSRFCHSCGASRPLALSPDVRADAAELAGYWEHAVAEVHSLVTRGVETVAQIRVPGWLHYLHFHEIKRWIGLPSASLIAFVIGMACVAGALLVGLLTAKTYVDWQAIQFYRAEWLLAATASFVAGILLNRPSKPDGE
jgi:hypothetical protein